MIMINNNNDIDTDNGKYGNSNSNVNNNNNKTYHISAYDVSNSNNNNSAITHDHTVPVRRLGVQVDDPTMHLPRTLCMEQKGYRSGTPEVGRYGTGTT